MDAICLIDAIIRDVSEHPLSTFERTLVRSLMLRMRPFDDSASFRGMFRDPRQAERLYPYIREYVRECCDAPPEVRVNMDAAVKTAMNGVRNK